MRPRSQMGTLRAISRPLMGLRPVDHSISRKFRVDLELIAAEEYLGVSPVLCVNAREGETVPMSSSG